MDGPKKYVFFIRRPEDSTPLDGPKKYVFFIRRPEKYVFFIRRPEKSPPWMALNNHQIVHTYLNDFGQNPLQAPFTVVCFWKFSL